MTAIVKATVSKAGASAHSLTDFLPDGVCLPSEVLAPQELAIAVARVGSGESSTEDTGGLLLSISLQGRPGGVGAGGSNGQD